MFRYRSITTYIHRHSEVNVEASLGAMGDNKDILIASTIYHTSISDISSGLLPPQLCDKIMSFVISIVGYISYHSLSTQ